MRPTVRRALRRGRQLVGDDPCWLPVVLRATPTGTARQLTDHTQLVIEGFPRSANTFAVFAVRHAERAAGREVQISSHVHTPSAVKAAVQQHFPTLVIVRQPVDVIVSLLIAAPHVRPADAIDEWIHHHLELLAYRDRFAVATFDEVTGSTDNVIARINTTFGTSFAPLGTSPATTTAVLAAIDGHHRRLHGDSEHLVPRPSPWRLGRARMLRAELDAGDHAARLARADALFQRYTC
jgi:hypothetical protein